MRKNYWFGLLLLLLGPGISPLLAQQPEQMTLADAVAYAKENSNMIKNAKINIADAEQLIIERRSFGLPQLSGKVDYQYYFDIPIAVLPDAFVEMARDPVTGMLPPDFSPEVSFSLKHNFNAGLSFSSLLFDGSYLTGLRAAKRFRDYTALELIQKERELANAVRDAYLPSLLITESLSTLDKNIANLTKLLNETKALYKEGFVEQLDVDRLELSLANLQTERDNLVRQRESAIDYLKFTISFPVNQQLTLTDDIDKLLEEATTEDLSASVNYNNYPLYKTAQLGLLLNQLNIELYQKGYLPSVSAFASYQYGFQGNRFDDSGFWAPVGIVGAQINIPIFDGFDKKAKVERARLGLALAQNQTRDLERAISLELQTSRTNYENALQRVASQKKNLDLAEKIYNTAQIKYREGVGSSLEITQAEQSLFTTQQNHIQALYDLLVAKSALDKALGR